jgi:hypothetical protein
LMKFTLFWTYFSDNSKVEAPIQKSDLISQFIKAPIVANMHTQK